MTRQSGKRRRRGVLLTPQGLIKLKATIKEAEDDEKYGERFTQDELEEKVLMSKDTLSKILANEEPVDKKSILIFFEAFELVLDNTDFQYPLDEISVSSVQQNYVERPPIETSCHETLLKPGALVRIKAPSLMGKTYLVEHLFQKLTAEGYRTAKISLQLADRNTHFNHLDRFLRWLCANLCQELGLAADLDKYWDAEGMGSKVSCSTFLEERLLANNSDPLILCLDDIDLLFPYPEVYEDFFGLLRSWHEKARSRKRWQRLRLIVVHSTDVYIRLNINQSPFNVGHPVELPDFDPEQVSALAQLFDLSPDLPRIGHRAFAELTHLVGGHPYLLQQAFQSLQTIPNSTLDVLLEDATTDAGVYRTHLRQLSSDLKSSPELVQAFKQVLQSSGLVHIESTLAYQLSSLGLVTLKGNSASVRCELYRTYFSDRIDEL